MGKIAKRVFIVIARSIGHDPNQRIANHEVPSMSSKYSLVSRVTRQVSLVTALLVYGVSGAPGQWSNCASAPAGSQCISASVGIGTTTTVTEKLEIVGNSATALFGKLTNSASAGAGAWLVQNDNGHQAEFGIRGSARAPYGALVASDGYMYSNGSLTLMADQASGVVKFASGGNAERMRIDSNGNVGIGVSVPLNKVHINAGADNAIIRMDSNSGVSYPSAGFLYMSSNTSNDRATLAVNAYFDANTWHLVELSKASWLAQLSTGSGDDVFKILRAAPGLTSFTQFFTIDSSGNVGIGPNTTAPSARLDVNGDINVSGNINAKYQDIAEWVPASTNMPPGTVVVLNPDRRNEVRPSTAEYDTSVAGVVSSKPGLILGEASPLKEMIATTGRVKVHVSADNGAIHIGDLLVTSDKRGLAMRSTPIDVAGVKLHRPGTVIGKALEPLEGGEGEILVLLSLQ